MPRGSPGWEATWRAALGEFPGWGSPGSQPSWGGCLQGTSIDFIVLAFFREQSS